MDRRDYLKAVGGIGAVTTLGVASMTNTVGATASISVDIDGTEYSGDQGDLDWLGVDVTKKIKWDGFDVPLLYIGFKHEVTIEDSGTTGWHTLYDDVSGRLTDWSSEGSGSDGWGGPGEYVKSHGGDKDDYLQGVALADVAWAIVSDGSHPSDYESVQDPVDWTDNISVDTDGSTETFVVKWKTTLTFYTEDADGNPVQITEADGIPQVSGTDKFSLLVTNEESTLESSSIGDSTAG